MNISEQIYSILTDARKVNSDNVLNTMLSVSAAQLFKHVISNWINSRASNDQLPPQNKSNYVENTAHLWTVNLVVNGNIKCKESCSYIIVIFFQVNEKD